MPHVRARRVLVSLRLLRELPASTPPDAPASRTAGVFSNSPRKRLELPWLSHAVLHVARH